MTYKILAYTLLFNGFLPSFVLNTSALDGDGEINRKNEIKASYNQERIKDICTQVRKVRELSILGDVPKLLELMRHGEPWVRERAYHALRTRTNLAMICKQPSFLKFDPWGRNEEIDKQVDIFIKTVQAKEKSVSWENYGLSDEQIKSVYAEEKKNRKTDAEILPGLILFSATSRIKYEADVQGLLFLKALLDHDDLNVRRLALSSLLLNTTPSLYPKSGKGLQGNGNANPKVIDEKKKEWLIWWEKNKNDFKLEKQPKPKR